MGRSRYGMKFPAASSDERQSIGDQHVHSACTTLDRLCQRTVTALTEYTTTREATIRALFDDADLDKLEAVRGFIEPSSNE